MPAVPELVEWQLLAGLQMVIAPFAVVTPLDRLSMAWAHVARAGVASVLDLDPGDLPGTYASRRAVEIAVLAARRLTTTPEQERAKDVWDLGVFGVAEMQALDFTHLHQRWLREAAKGYTIERLATRKARTAHRDLLALKRVIVSQLSTLEVTSDSENKLLSRREVVGTFTAGNGFITRQAAAEAIGTRLGVKKEDVQVMSLKGKFGTRDTQSQRLHYLRR